MLNREPPTTRWFIGLQFEKKGEHVFTHCDIHACVAAKQLCESFFFCNFYFFQHLGYNTYNTTQDITLVTIFTIRHNYNRLHTTNYSY